MLLRDIDTTSSFVKAMQVYGELEPDSQVAFFTGFVLFNYLAILKLSSVPWLGITAMTCSLISIIILNDTYKQSLQYAHS